MIDVYMKTEGLFGSVQVDAVSEKAREYFVKHFGHAACGVTLSSKASASYMLEDMSADGLIVEVDAD